MGSKEIIVIGPNPAYQKTMTFDQLTVDKVNRATNLRVYTGGKGTNFCRASKCYKGEPHFCEATLYMFTGGSNGESVKGFLRDEGIRTHCVDVPHNTRTCITCLDVAHNTMTELIEPSFPVPADAAAAMDAAVEKALSTAAAVAVMGSLPDHTDPELYTRWTRMAAAANKPILIDAVKGIEASLQVPGARTILKVNLDELRKMTGKSSPEEAFAHAMKTWTVEVLAITNGPGRAFLQQRGKPIMVFTIPPLDNVISPLGAGDTADAVFLAEYVNGTDAVEAFRLALAAASANCLQADAGVFTIPDMAKVEKGVTVAPFQSNM